MTKNIGFTMTNVSQTAVSPINADGTVATSSSSNALVFISPIVSQKGRPFELIAVNSANWLDKLGKPYHSSLGPKADAMRCLGDAVKGATGYVVRVVPEGATYPAIKLSKPDTELVVVNEAVPYGSDLELGDGEFLALAIKDGAQSDSRKLTIEAADATLYGSDMFMVTLTETDSTGYTETLEEWVVSLEPTATDSMGAQAYIQTVLESKSSYLECVIDSDAAQVAFTGLTETAFTGASNGSIGDITASDYDAAISVIDNAAVNFNYVVGLGLYDTLVQAKLHTLQNNKRLSGAFDLNPRLTHDEALTVKQGLSLNQPRALYTHFPYTATCPYYGNKTMWGLSGVVVAAKALGLAKTSPTAGWHYTPAGVDRATISRTGLAPMKGAGTPDYEAMYKARLNKVAVSENGNLFIDDSLSSGAQENYLRFEQVVSVTDAISREFDALANRIKHLPDGITLENITNGMTDILESYESVGALVPPRNPDQDGTEAWTFSVTQVEIDYWKVTWSICVTGSGRRFLGEPILIR